MKLMKLFFSATAVCLLLGTSGAAMAELEFTGCLKDNGKLKRVAPGEFPTKACKKKETVIQFPSQEQIDILKGIETAALEITVDCGGGDVLQDAINEALPYTTILVEGTCNENISIGPGKAGLTLDGQGSASITAADDEAETVSISGVEAVTIRNFNNGSITGGSRGIVVADGASVTIDNNDIEGSSGSGITVDGGSLATITGNQIQGHGINGIAVNEASVVRIGTDCSLGNLNTISGNTESGISLTENSQASILGNIISGNTVNGIIVSDGAVADTASNEISANGGEGIDLRRGAGVRMGRVGGVEGCGGSPNSTEGDVNGGFGVQCSSLSVVDGELGTLDGDDGATDLKDDNADCPNCCFASVEIGA